VNESILIPGRECGSCTMCCKLLRIEELGKAEGEWCTHCAIGKGCTIYDTRPEACRGFYCGWLTLPMLDDKWFPAKAKLMVFPSPDGGRLNILVDPSRPGGWREEPYYSEIRGWAKHAGARIQVVVMVGSRLIAVLPDGEIDLGVVGERDRLVYYEANEGGRTVLRARIDKVE